jgi:hypothetical protein
MISVLGAEVLIDGLIAFVEKSLSASSIPMFHFTICSFHTNSPTLKNKDSFICFNMLLSCLEFLMDF